MSTGTRKSLSTSELDVSYTEHGPEDGRPVVLVHGWPDSSATWDRVVPSVVAAGGRVFCPDIRAHGATRFKDDAIPRSGQIAAYGRDLGEFIDALGLNDVLLVGHDWGARATYVVGQLFASRVRQIITLSSAPAVKDLPTDNPYRFGPMYWYEYFLATKVGRAAFEQDRAELCRFLWGSWSPGWNFSDEEYASAAKAIENPDWVEVTIHNYLHRWGELEGAPQFEELETRLAEFPPIQVPTLLLHGANDPCVGLSVGLDHRFEQEFERIVLPGVGHFIQREAPEAVVDAILRFLR